MDAVIMHLPQLVGELGTALVSGSWLQELLRSFTPEVVHPKLTDSGLLEFLKHPVSICKVLCCMCIFLEKASDLPSVSQKLCVSSKGLTLTDDKQ